MTEQKLRDITRDHEWVSVGLLALAAQRATFESPMEKLVNDYVADLKALGCSSDRVRHVDKRLRRLIRECQWQSLYDATADSCVRWRAGLTQLFKISCDLAFQHLHHPANFSRRRQLATFCLPSYRPLAHTEYLLQFHSSGRGMVAGQIVINDPGNPNASASNLWVGVEQQPASTITPTPTDFQLWGKSYQYWTKTDANGTFTISNVITSANYTLFAFGPGTADQFQSQSLSGASPTCTIDLPASPFSVSVNAGQTNGLGTVTWTPTRVGAMVWQIGVSDRDTTEFQHGDDYWHGDLGNATNMPSNWAPFEDFSLDFQMA